MAHHELITPPTPDGNNVISFITPSAPDTANTEVANSEVIAPKKEEVLDEISDYLATDGEMLKIYTWDELSTKYLEDEGRDIPAKVKARAQEKGITQGTMSGTADSNQDAFSSDTVSDSSDIDEWHTWND